MTAPQPQPLGYECCDRMSSDGEHNCNFRQEPCRFVHTAKCKDYIPCKSCTTTSAEKVLDVQQTPIICLCGSTRFTREMLIKQWELTKQGYIVVSWCALPDDYYQGDEKFHIGDQEGVKEYVDEIHKRKIDISDEVLVIDLGGYVGTSTRSEIDYAIKHGKPVRYLSEELRQQEKRGER